MSKLSETKVLRLRLILRTTRLHLCCTSVTISSELIHHLTWSSEKHSDSLVVQTRWEFAFIWNDGFVIVEAFFLFSDMKNKRASLGRVWGFKVIKISLWRPLSCLYLSGRPDNRRPSALCIVHKLFERWGFCSSRSNVSTQLTLSFFRGNKRVQWPRTCFQCERSFLCGDVWFWRR